MIPAVVQNHISNFTR